jgi:hypothetical protein
MTPFSPVSKKRGGRVAGNRVAVPRGVAFARFFETWLL